MTNELASGTFRYNPFTVSNEPVYVLNYAGIMLYRQSDKAYISCMGEESQISMGAFNKATAAIAGLSDEAAADLLRIQVQTNVIKPIGTMYPARQHRRQPRSKAPLKIHKKNK